MVIFVSVSPAEVWVTRKPVARARTMIVAS